MPLKNCWSVSGPLSKMSGKKRSEESRFEKSGGVERAISICLWYGGGHEKLTTAETACARVAFRRAGGYNLARRWFSRDFHFG